MGSGHFLVAAIDRIEERMVKELDERPLPNVRRELAELRSAARKFLGEAAESISIDDGLILRRLIARRCIYGVDNNALAVQLTRLSIWIHTFVPGLPLSFLDHNLVRGNSVVGVGDMKEIGEKINLLTRDDEEELLGRARGPLRRLANSRDQTTNDIAASKKAMDEAKEATRETEALCDIITAKPISKRTEIMNFHFTDKDWRETVKTILQAPALRAAREELAGVDALHFPVAFPEIFWRENPGFDVIIGNPPWEKVKVEKHAFWARHFPGLRGLESREQELRLQELEAQRPDLAKLLATEIQAQNNIREFLVSGNYPGMGKGDPDLHKAFCWRFWNMLRKDGGMLGVVLPRGVFLGSGSEQFRKEIMSKSGALRVTFLVNQGKWIFPEVDGRYSISLCTVKRGEVGGDSIHLNGPFFDGETFASGKGKFSRFDARKVSSWSESASFPLFPSPDSVVAFEQIRKSPPILQSARKDSEWFVRPYREFDTSGQKDLIDRTSKSCPKGFWPVYTGASFNLWTPDTGVYYGWTDPARARAWAFEKRLRAARNSRSPHFGFPQSYIDNIETLPCNHPRIAFRDIARATDRRTVIACLVPPSLFLTHKSPYLLWPYGDQKDQAYLLGVLSSIPLDWYARRFVETNLTFDIFDSLPIPRPDRNNPLWMRVVFLAASLAGVDERYDQWMEAVGVRRTELSEEERQRMIEEIDACVAHLYGLSEEQLIHIFETFHVGWNFQARLESVLSHYGEWKNNLGHADEA